MVKTLTVTEEAYERLASKKTPGESFSNVILRVTGKGSILDLVGILDEKSARELESSVTETRSRMRRVEL